MSFFKNDELHLPTFFLVSQLLKILNCGDSKLSKMSTKRLYFFVSKYDAYLYVPIVFVKQHFGENVFNEKYE